MVKQQHEQQEQQDHREELLQEQHLHKEHEMKMQHHQEEQQQEQQQLDEQQYERQIQHQKQQQQVTVERELRVHQQPEQQQHHDTLKHIVDRVIAGVQSIINTTRLSEDISSELLEIREDEEEAATRLASSPRFHVRLGVDNTNLEQEGLGIRINITSRNAASAAPPNGTARPFKDDIDSFETNLIFSQQPIAADLDNRLDASPVAESRSFRPDGRGRRRLEEERLVTTLTGTVRGEAFVSPGGAEYYRFDGIPYAEPPVGELRFRPPVKKRFAKGVINGNRTAAVKCLQA